MTNQEPVSPPGFLVQVLGKSSRRVACDRCRAQKLRCQYDGSGDTGKGKHKIDIDAGLSTSKDPDPVAGLGGSSAADNSPPGPCRRCRRAGTECTQSPPMRIGRPVKSGRRRSSQADTVSSASFPPADASDLPSAPAGQARQQGQKQEHSNNNNINVYAESSNNLAAADAVSATPRLQHEHGLSGMSSFHFHTALGVDDGHHNHEDMLRPETLDFVFGDQPPMFASEVSPLTSSFFADTPFPTMSSDHHHHQQVSSSEPPPPPHMAATTPFASGLFQTPVYAVARDRSAGTQGPDVGQPAGTYLSELEPAPKHDVDVDMELYPSEPTTPKQEARHVEGHADAAVRRLLDLNARLYRLGAEVSRLSLSSVSSSSPSSSSTSSSSSATSVRDTGSQAPSFPCEDYHVDRILRATQSYLDVLASLNPPRRSSHSSGKSYNEMHDRGGDNHPHASAESAAGTASSDSFFASSFIGTGTSDTYGSPGATEENPSLLGGAGGSGSGSGPDIHALLVAVSCYTRIMRVYSDMVAYIHREARACTVACAAGDGAQARVGAGAAVAAAAAPLLPELQLGTIQIPNDASLHALLLVRIGLHMIERVDRAIEDLLDRTATTPADREDDDDGKNKNKNSSNLPDLEGPGTSRDTNGRSRGRRAVSSINSPGCLARSILNAAIEQDSLESRQSGRRGIVSLREDIMMLEQLIQ